nr:DUF2723 domain-containing protein [candidate division Zixibacteria bacterium]
MAIIYKNHQGLLERITRNLAILSPVPVSLIVFWITCFRTITWWDNSSYSLAAVTLGVDHPPGSLLTTLIGWLAVQLPIGFTSIFILNLLAGLAASLTTGLVCFLSVRLVSSSQYMPIKSPHRNITLSIIVPIAVATLILPFSTTMWSYTAKFTPYVMTVMMTALILFAMMVWWRKADTKNSFGWLFVITLLFGLDFSIHRTNMLLLPGLPVWILLRRPRILKKVKTWLVGLGGLISGLAFHLVLIPMATRNPFLNINNPSNLTRFYEYISLKQYGGGWLLGILPRKGDFLNDQVLDYLNDFAANFIPVNGIFGFLGFLPVLFGIIGIAFIIVKNRRLAAGLIAMFLLTSLGAVIYFNVPADFFRSMDRHYMPSFLIFSFFIASGAGYLMSSLTAIRDRGFLKKNLPRLLFLFILAAPTYLLFHNYRSHDQADNFITHDMAANILNSVPPDGLLVVGGDNDTWPVWYLQQAEKIRTDVTVINIYLLNLKWYIRQIHGRYPDLIGSAYDDTNGNYDLIKWRDSAVVIPGAENPGEFDLPVGTALPDSVILHVRPNIADQYLLIADQVLLEIITNNCWEKPICLTTGISLQERDYLTPYLRLEGLTLRMVPITDPPLNPELLEENLLKKYTYSGFADSSLILEQPSLWYAGSLYVPFIHLCNHWAEAGNCNDCERIKNKMLEYLPPNRTAPPQNLVPALEYLCRD